MADGSIPGLEPQRLSHTAPVQAAPKPNEASRAGTDAGAGEPGKVADKRANDPMRDLLDRLDQLHPLLARTDSGLAAGIKSIVQQAEAHSQIDEARFRTRVAYALQDLERAHGTMQSVAGSLREEMTLLAGTAPGLQNERMQALMRSTATIDDRGLVRDIRRSAAEIARDGNHATPETDSKVEVLENRVRLSARAGEIVDTLRPGEHQNGSQTAVKLEAKDRLENSSVPTVMREIPVHERPVAVAPVIQTGSTDQVQQAGKLGATFAIMNALRRPEPDTPAPWDKNLTPLKGRLDRWMENDKGNSEEASLKAAERSGQIAAQLLRTFASAPESNVMAKIKEAGKSDPDGEAGVIAGMREGGPYQDLRRTFNADLVREKGYAALLDRVTAAVNKYGADRTVADTIATGRADAATINARFEKLDAEVFKGASTTPSRTEGKSQMEELGDRAAELAKKAVDAFRAAFSRSPAAGHASPSPSI